MRYTLAQIRSLLKRLDGEPADALESETLECKPWDSDPRSLSRQLRELREAVICFANAQGGTILLGIQDKKRTRREAITGVARLDVEVLRRAVYAGTDPHILVDVEELKEPEGRILAIHVPRGLGVHTTTEGVAKIRVGKDCQPLTGSMLAGLLVERREVDLTAQIAPGAGVGDLDSAQIEQLQRFVATQGQKPELASLRRDEFLENLALLRNGEIPLAAVLLLGRSPTLSKWAPNHEVIFIHYKSRTLYDDRRVFKGPILEILGALKNRLESHARIATTATSGFGEITTPDLTWETAREAILNAVVHRDYFLHQAVYIELRRGRIEVSSPGGFIGGVTPANILRHPPVRRNPLLADVLDKAGFVNRAGMGVDRMFDDLLRLGKATPRYDADESQVRLTLPTTTHPAFVRFVAEETREGRTLDLDDLIILRAVTDRGHADRWSAAQCLQTSEDEAAGRLVSLRERGYLQPRGRGRGTSYYFARAYSDLLRGRLETDEALPLDHEAVRLRLQAVLAERGRMTNAEVRRISGYSRSEALRLIRSLREAGLAVVSGRGRAAHYVPGPKLKSQVPVGRSPKRRPRG